MKIFLPFFLVLFQRVAFSQQDTTIYSTVDKEAEFQGGAAAMMSWIQNNLVYPLEAVEHSLIDSRTYISFIVESNGTLSQVLINSKCEPCKKSIMTLMKNSPNWIPAQLNGRNVRSKYVIPITCLYFE